ncbi:MAG: hypothetical protein DRP45_05535 [Candidatus Zixiibacteriota bacterium]|nr:MAG: hypothetical protein DRP45_05535 [candidate division Zixibacteria bacterium]
MTLNKVHNEDGSSLLEVLVSLLMITIGVLGMTVLIATSIGGNVTSRDNSVAANLIKEQIEYYQGLDSLPTLPLQLSESALNSRFARITSVFDSVSDTTVPGGLCQIDVLVTWTDNENTPHSRTFSTYIPNF